MKERAEHGVLTWKGKDALGAWRRILETSPKSSTSLRSDLSQKSASLFVITHIEPDIMECEVKWALRTKLVEVLEFQLSSFKS